METFFDKLDYIMERPALFVPLLASLWVVVGFALSRIGKWHSLARRFRAAEKPNGKAFAFKSGQIGVVSYGNCLNVTLAKEGLHLSVFFPFRIGHPPLLLPWTEVSRVEKKKTLWWEYVVVTIGDPEVGMIALPEKAIGVLTDLAATGNGNQDA